MVAVVLVVAPVQAMPGVDDYPSALKSAAQDAKVDPWLFYNRECTSFVAWRLNNDNHVDFSNYYLGVHWGNASNWRTAANAAGVTVNGTAAVGAVAWWKKGSAGSSSGHVAWVESLSSSSVTVEEYNYLHRGKYDTRTIASTSSVWPTAFIHIKPVAMTNTVKPAISGTARVGSTLSASTGSWTPAGATYTYGWASGGKLVPGATGRTFTPTAAQLGQQIRVRVTATLGGVPAKTVKSEITAAVAPGVIANTVVPTLSGTPQVGAALKVAAGSWTPAGATYAYQWLASGVAIAGATTSSYVPTATDLGKTIAARVTVTKTGYTTKTVTTASSVAVVPGQFTATGTPTITGAPRVGTPVTASPGVWSPAPAYRYQWLASGNAIPGATASSYTPGPEQMGRQLQVAVTATRAGYTQVVSTSPASPTVAAGTIANSAPPRVLGTAQVGATLTAYAGTWSPAPTTTTYQWLDNGNPVAGRAGSSFVVGPAQLGHQLSVQVTVSRNGYYAPPLTSAVTQAVAEGIIESTRTPTISGHPWVGSTLTASPGAWSPAQAAVAASGYQWLADGVPTGAEGPTHVVTPAEVGKRLAVRVTAAVSGYRAATAVAPATAPVVLGAAAFSAAPTVTGKPLLGRRLSVRPGTFAPSATPAFQWFRADKAIRGATASSHVTTRADLGKRISVLVTVAPDRWAPASRRTAKTPAIRVKPKVTVRTVTRAGKVYLSVSVRAPGVKHAHGRVRLRLGRHLLRSLVLRDGRATGWFGPFAAGRRHFGLVVAGDKRLSRVTRTLTIRVS